MIDGQLDHVAIAVHRIRAALPVYCDALGATFLAAGDVPEQGFRWAQFRFPDGGKVELVTPTGDGFVRRFLDRRGEGVHHVTIRTEDIAAAIAHLESRGVPLFNVSTEGRGWKEAFVHPRDAHGVLIQVAQSAFDDEEMARHHLSDHSASSHRHLRLEDL